MPPAAVIEQCAARYGGLGRKDVYLGAVGKYGIYLQKPWQPLDTSLIPLGEVESGLEYLAGKKGGFPAKIEILEK